MKKKTVTCPACSGTGGSAGNEDPKDDWICSVCDGVGSYEIDVTDDEVDMLR